MANDKDRYLKLMSFKSPEEAYAQIKDLSSNLTVDQHVIRSCIFDLHAAIEMELRRIFFHTFKAQLFLTTDEEKNLETIEKFEKAVGRLSFSDMHRVLRPVLLSWPYPDLENISSINETRNLAAHSNAVDRVTYRGRNPFIDADCFAQMFFDVWAIQQSMTKFFGWVITAPRDRMKRYVDRYGTEA